MDAAPATGSATMEAIVDADGRATSVRVLSANADFDRWSGVASQIARLLASRRMRVPPNSRGFAIQFALEARQQLPSGAAPGKAVQVRPGGAQFDLSDIGARPTRMVYVHVVTVRL